MIVIEKTDTEENIRKKVDIFIKSKNYILHNVITRTQLTKSLYKSKIILDFKSFVIDDPFNKFLTNVFQFSNNIEQILYEISADKKIDVGLFMYPFALYGYYQYKEYVYERLTKTERTEALLSKVASLNINLLFKKKEGVPFLDVPFNSQLPIEKEITNIYLEELKFEKIKITFPITQQEKERIYQIILDEIKKQIQIDNLLNSVTKTKTWKFYHEFITPILFNEDYKNLWENLKTEIIYKQISEEDLINHLDIMPIFKINKFGTELAEQYYFKYKKLMDNKTYRKEG